MIGHIITLGIGTPGGIAPFILVGLNAAPPVIVDVYAFTLTMSERQRAFDLTMSARTVTWTATIDPVYTFTLTMTDED